VLTAWAETGHTSLRAITRELVLEHLPPDGNPRATTIQGLRSIFQVLRGQRHVFVNPMRVIGSDPYASNIPAPANIDVIKAALTSPNPTRAALAALTAFHALSSRELRGLQLGDVRGGRLHLEDRTILLAEPVIERLDAYLAHRTSRWPSTANPHLFVNLRTEPVGPQSITRTLDITVTAIREDRILDEFRSSGGDMRRLCDMFGLSTYAAGRYLATLEPPNMVLPKAPVR
jgi:site-specific recombinase XerD